MIDLEELKKKAEAAGGGQWNATLSTDGAIIRAAVCHGDGDVLCECFSNIGHQPDPVFEDDIAQFIAAANPQTVLDLVLELEEARKDAELYRTLRAMHWTEDKLCVIKAKYAPIGSTAFSGEELDRAILASSQQQDSKDGHE
jgi:hypothetical protein